MDKTEYNKQPYMGQISASRVSGRMNLYGSPITHEAAIKITVTKSKSYMQYDREYYSPGDTLVDLYLSPAQWAEFLTSMNHGAGIPCTLRFDLASGGHQPLDVPDPEPFAFQDDGHVAISQSKEFMQAVQDKVEALATKGKAGKKELEDLLRSVKVANDNLRPNWNFAAKVLLERAEKVKAVVKKEIAAMIENAGISHIYQQITDNKNKELE